MPEPTPSAAAPALQRAGRGWRTWRERGIVVLLFAAASVATLATAAIFLTLMVNGWDFFRAVSLKEFFTGTDWAPDFPPPRFGSVPLVKGTFQIALGAVAIGLPLGVGSALFISEFAGPRVRRVLKPAIEILAGIPSIVFGLVALFVLSPIIASIWGTGTFTALAATAALGIMVVPIIASISEDALRAVPVELREASLALGATRWETTWSVVLPAAKSGVTASIILGFSWNYLEPTQTITAFIANRAGGDLPTGSIEYLAIFALGAVLFILTFAINLVAEYVLSAQRRKFA
jgi:phosphate transport system permease protein